MGMTASRETGKGSVKIKRVGGHVQEFHRPISVQEVMLRNPKHWVTKPHVFRSQNPVAEVVPPEAVLMQGQTVLLVPFKTMQALLERHHLCHASLDHLMDRPGLVIREWYQQHRKRMAVACPLKDCKCPCAKKDGSKRMMGSSTKSSLKAPTPKPVALPDPTFRVRNSPELDICLKKTNLKCLEASKSGGSLFCKDTMYNSSNKSNEVNMPICANFMNEVKHESQSGIEKNCQHTNEGISEKQASKASIPYNKSHGLLRQESQNDVKHENNASLVPHPVLQEYSNKEISRKHVLKESIASHNKDPKLKPQATTHWPPCNELISSHVARGNIGYSQFFGACTCCPSSPLEAKLEGANK